MKPARGVGTRFISCRDFVRTQFADAALSPCEGEFHTASDGFETHAKVSKGAYEVHSGCWHHFVSQFRPHVVRRTSWNLLGEEFRTDSDGFEMPVEKR